MRIQKKLQVPDVEFWKEYMYVLIQLSALALLFRPFKAWSTLFYGRLMHILLIMLKFCFLFFCIVVKLNYYVKVWSICVSALLQLLSGCRAIKVNGIYLGILFNFYMIKLLQICIVWLFRERIYMVLGSNILDWNTMIVLQKSPMQSTG